MLFWGLVSTVYGHVGSNEKHREVYVSVCIVNRVEVLLGVSDAGNRLIK